MPSGGGIHSINQLDRIRPEAVLRRSRQEGPALAESGPAGFGGKRGKRTLPVGACWLLSTQRGRLTGSVEA
jgi:hypothetical protein